MKFPLAAGRVVSAVSILLLGSGTLCGSLNTVKGKNETRYLITVAEIQIAFDAPSFPYSVGKVIEKSPGQILDEALANNPNYPNRHLKLNKEIGFKNEWFALANFNFTIMEYKRAEGFVDWVDFAAYISRDAIDPLKWEESEGEYFGMNGIRAYYNSFESGVPATRFSRANFVREAFFFKSTKGSIIGIWFVFSEYEKLESVKSRSRYSELAHEIKAHLELQDASGRGKGRP